MTKPVRLQLRRDEGYRLQEASRAVNGLPATKVDRATKWGNPFVVGRPDPRRPGAIVKDRAEAVALYPKHIPSLKRICEDARAALRGRNLACWCALGEPCHADVLLELVNK